MNTTINYSDIYNPHLYRTMSLIYIDLNMSLMYIDLNMSLIYIDLNMSLIFIDLNMSRVVKILLFYSIKTYKLTIG